MGLGVYSDEEADRASHPPPCRQWGPLEETGQKNLMSLLAMMKRIAVLPRAPRHSEVSQNKGRPRGKER